MKHTLRITLLLVFLFLIAHFLGLIILNNYSAEELPLGLEPPEVEEKPIRRKIFVNVFPERELADLMYRYRQFCCGLPRETILEMVALDRIGKEKIPRRFDGLDGHIDTHGYSSLCNGELRRDLEVFLKEHSDE